MFILPKCIGPMARLTDSRNQQDSGRGGQAAGQRQQEEGRPAGEQGREAQFSRKASLLSLCYSGRQNKLTVEWIHHVRDVRVGSFGGSFMGCVARLHSSGNTVTTTLFLNWRVSLFFQLGFFFFFFFVIAVQKSILL